MVIDNGGGGQKRQGHKSNKNAPKQGNLKTEEIDIKQKPAIRRRKDSILVVAELFCESDDIGNLFLVFLVEVVRGIV